MPSSSKSEPRRFWPVRQSRDAKARRPVAYVTMQDAGTRAHIVSILERAGWTVIPLPTGFHMLQSIADVVEGRYTWLEPTLIVIDAYARGCAGTTIAAGLRELGVKIPIVLVTTAGQRVPVTADDALSIADTSDVPGVVEGLAAAQSTDGPGNTANETACHSRGNQHLERENAHPSLHDSPDRARGHDLVCGRGS